MYTLEADLSYLRLLFELQGVFLPQKAVIALLSCLIVRDLL